MQIKSIVVIVAGVLFLLTDVVQAGVSAMTVAVDGMACPFCAFGVEKRLKKVKGVATIAVDMKTGTANLMAKPKVSIHYQEVPEAIKDAGFTAGTMKITVSGTVTTEDNSSYFILFNGPPLLIQSENNKMTARLSELSASGKSIVLNGVLSRQTDNNWSVVPESIEMARQ